MASACPILDEAHLTQQTFGDIALEREVRALFVEQLNALIPRVAALDGPGRDAALHRLKGSARAMGAMALARLAEDLEGREGSSEGTAALQALLAATLRALRTRSA